MFYTLFAHIHKLLIQFHWPLKKHILLEFRFLYLIKISNFCVIFVGRWSK
jgi:hypothetical protein